jgi:hypothetical protein
VVVDVALELGEGGVDVVEFRVSGAMAGEDVVGELEEAGDLTAGESVVFDDDVGAEEFEGGSSPVGLGEGMAACGELEGVEVDGGAGGVQGLISAAAVVDAEVLKNADGGGLSEGDIANGERGGEVLGGAGGCR